MTSPIDDLVSKMKSLEAELENEIDRLLAEKQQLFRYSIEKGKVKFEQGIKAFQQSHKLGLWQYLRTARLGHILSAPLVYSVLIPLVLLDLAASLYQQVCFRIYSIPLVKRNNYVIIDRQKLAYLNTIERINCMYCGYGNGVIEYVREITARTELYWCPIKHAQRTLDPHKLEEKFIDYGDAENYKLKLQSLQKEATILVATSKTTTL